MKKNMERKKKAKRRWVVLAMVGCLCGQPMMAQSCGDGEYARVLTPVPFVGACFNADTNDPIFTVSLYGKLELGLPTDLLSFNVGIGYRGFFDRRPPEEFLWWENRTLSDEFFYTNKDGTDKQVRPVGGHIVLPAELQLRLIRLGDDTRLFLGFGAELGWRVYESNRYAGYYGDHMLNKASLNIRPMIGVCGGDDELNLSMALYWRHYVRAPMNYENLYRSEKFDAKDFFGIQFSVTMDFF
jgi:hypothetical protein